MHFVVVMVTVVAVLYASDAIDFFLQREAIKGCQRQG